VLELYFDKFTTILRADHSIMNNSEALDIQPGLSDTPSGSSITKRLAKPERGERLEIFTNSFAFEGKAVGRREDGYVIFIEGALGGERVIAEILKAKGSFAEAKLVEIIEPSPDRRAPICPYFGICGGCALQHMNYEGQLHAKKIQVRDLFQRIGKIAEPPVRDVLGAGSEYHYRNKMEFSFSEERWLTEDEIGSDSRLDRFALGLHVRNRFDRVIDTKVCFLPKPVVTDILNFSRTFAREHHLGVYSPEGAPHPNPSPAGRGAKNNNSSDGRMVENNNLSINERSVESNSPSPSGRGVGVRDFLRFLVIKTSHATGEIMVNLVTSREELDIMKEYTRELLATVPGITTVINTINGRRAQVATGDSEKVYHGEGTIRDKIGSAFFQISANSFFQSNTPQAERLYKVATDFADLQPSDILWDLYCGTGTISLFVADQVKHVLGIELVESAIADARANAEANGISNVEFIASDLRRALTEPDFLAVHSKPDVMIIDPPRSGMHSDVIREILKLAPERIAYISCNPATQARDVALLAEGYELLDLQPVDMFPQTYHIECVAKLQRKK
jgi:23S rRNA (uracil1939-C5)-methyltransferase